ncbi:hypothetical protein PENCOP_c002G08447 [Penicillium coprophilum]|uniref:Uncharacterized protein n=1 Tax=Penicillium coprophilum TaxID=36646 RepID=A0A1V6V3C0_9EURO|nr:hypothetical protein PENCOP_c002G08447 [Penicillium coprophilum]
MAIENEIRQTESPLDFVPPLNYVRLVFPLPLKPDADDKLVFTDLHQALHNTFSDCEFVQVILDSMMDLDAVEPVMSNPWEGNSSSRMAMESVRPSYYSDASERGSARRSQEDRSSDSDGSSMTSVSKVKFSVTCQRGKLKSVVKHIVDAAMAESGELATEEDQVTLTLQLRG